MFCFVAMMPMHTMLHFVQNFAAVIAVQWCILQTYAVLLLRVGSHVTCPRQSNGNRHVTILWFYFLYDWHVCLHAISLSHFKLPHRTGSAVLYKQRAQLVDLVLSKVNLAIVLQSEACEICLQHLCGSILDKVSTSVVEEHCMEACEPVAFCFAGVGPADLKKLAYSAWSV